MESFNCHVDEEISIEPGTKPNTVIFSCTATLTNSKNGSYEGELRLIADLPLTTPDFLTRFAVDFGNRLIKDYKIYLSQNGLL